MQFRPVLQFNVGHEHNHWSEHPDIGKIADGLTPKDQKFLKAVGRVLARSGQSDRFAVTLLHSHFHVSGGEILVDRFDRARKFIVTRVEQIETYEEAELIPKSWSFPSAGNCSGSVQINVLTWITNDDVSRRPLDNNDTVLMRAIGALYRSHNAEGRFGMALVGQQPEVGKTWVEGDVSTTRCLIQEQLALAEVEERNSIKTMWIFDETGKHITVLGCCRRTLSGNGHTGSKHGPGW